MHGSSAGLASDDFRDAAGALFELQAGAKYVDEGKSIVKMRASIGGSGEEVDIILTDGTFVEVQLGQLTSAEAKKKISRNKSAGAKQVVFVFSEGAQIKETWRNSVREYVMQKLKIPVVIKRLIINPDGTKSWEIVEVIQP